MWNTESIFRNLGKKKENTNKQTKTTNKLENDFEELREGLILDIGRPLFFFREAGKALFRGVLSGFRWKNGGSNGGIA